MSTCPACSSSVPEDSRYCPACGAALAADEAREDSTVIGDSSMLTADDTPDLIDHGSFLPGTIIAERYRIVGLLGKGGMGEVYRADDLKLGQTVALKFLPADLAADPRRRERFHNEVRIARQVAHPNLCRVYDLGEVAGHTYLSMEYVDGEDLSSLLRRIGRVPRAKAVEVARQLCAGLAAAHEQGILHRDLKPANVMIDGRGKVRITDFGLAALAGGLVGPAARAGTPSYMAPEQLAGKEFTIRSEVYTLGLVLYELFTGKRAFKADSLEEYARLHAELIPVKPSAIVASVEPAVERVILQCLEKDPDLRPSSPVEVAKALPGGDPLAAALAAGETPSPELVAATTPAEGIRPAVSAACLIVVLLGIVAFPLLNDHVKLHGFVLLSKSPEVLVDRSREIVRRLGYQQRPADWAFGFDVNEAYLSHIEKDSQSSTRWARLALGRPAAMQLWYRQSPRDLVPTNMLGTVTFSDPPPLVPGMVSLRLDPRGRLIHFHAVPPARELAAAAAPPDWSQLFRAAQLDPQRFRPVNPETVPPMYCDHREAWVGRCVDDPGVDIRLEAAGFQGKPVYFELRFPASPDEPSPGFTALQASRLINVLLLLVSLAGAAALARRNLALGRGDRRGAGRVAVFVAAALMAAWVLRANHVTDALEELKLLAVAAGRSLVAAGICWVLYISFEPYVRQRRPEILISWNRLLASRLRDPVVGRDILIGGLFGIFGVLLTAMLYFAPGLFGAPPPRPAAVSNLSFLGLRYDLAQLLQILTMAVLVPMAILLLLLLLLVLVRSRRLGVLALFIILTGVSTLITLQPGGNIYVNAAVYGMLTAAIIFVLVRFGLLAVMIAGFYMLLLERFPITANLDAWYVQGSYFALLIAAGLAVFGFSTSLRGRRPRRRSLLLD
jgi:serine/threonine protein kinase